ncbi:MAG: BatA domain-containing protein, partial [Candidatus Marinimicrobia bacterium]|nr:BatA domain-containing protein [Candidatus Neomarinimicrobiota bacterium]
MSFINSFFLYLLPLAVIPLVIHLIGRQRYYQHEFSTLRFLKQLEHDLIRKLKIRQILLLLLRILLILLIVLTFARPYRTTRSPGIYVGKGETLYLIIDNSLSMQNRLKGMTLLEYGMTVLTMAGKRIDYPVYLKLIETAGASQIHDHGLVMDPSALETIIESVNLTNQQGNIDCAIQMVTNDVNRQNEISSAVWILSDFQTATWQSEERPVHPLNKLLEKTNSRLIFFPVAGENGNVSLSFLSLPDQIYEKGQPASVRAFMENWNRKSSESSVGLFLDDRKLGQSLVSIQSGEEANVLFEFIPPDPGIYKGCLKIADDNILMDNTRYFLINIPETIRVLIVTRYPEDGKYIKQSLSVKEMSVIDSKMISSGMFPSEDLLPYDLIVFSNIDRFSKSIMTKIQYFIEMNKGILLFPGKDCNREVFNAFWSDQMGFPKWRTMRQSEGNQQLRIGELKRDHPIFSNVWRENRSLIYSPDFYVIPGFSVGKDHSVLANFEDNTPFIIETDFKNGAGILLASSPVDKWSNLHLTGFFPALMNRIVFYLSQKGLHEQEYNTGDTLKVSVSRYSTSGDIAIRT